MPVEEEPDERTGKAERARRKAVAPAACLSIGRADPTSDLRPSSVLFEIVEERVRVELDEPRHHSGITAEAGLVRPGCGGFRQRLEHAFLDRPAVVRKA